MSHFGQTIAWLGKAIASVPDAFPIDKSMYNAKALARPTRFTKMELTNTSIIWQDPAKTRGAVNMKPLDHPRGYFKCRQPSLARRITIYFSVFGLVVFAVTAVLYVMSSQKQFSRATAQLIRNQVLQIEGSSEPDFIWRRVGGPLPSFIDLTRMLANFSASFYSVSDISLYARSAENGLWYQLY